MLELAARGMHLPDKWAGMGMLAVVAGAAARTPHSTYACMPILLARLPLARRLGSDWWRGRHGGSLADVLCVHRMQPRSASCLAACKA